MGLASDVTDYLDAQNITGGSTGWKACYGFYPDQPDKVVLITEVGGLEMLQLSDGVMIQPMIQVRVRSARLDHDGAIAKMAAVITALNNTQISDSVYCFVLSNTRLEGIDSNERPSYLIDMRLLKDG